MHFNGPISKNIRPTLKFENVYKTKQSVLIYLYTFSYDLLT